MSCPVNLGRNARIKLDTTTIARMTSMDVTINNETIDITSFGDEWMKFCRGMQSWTATITGHLDLDDASQSTLVDAAENGTLINNLRFYIDSTNYFASNVVADTEAGLYIDNYNFTADNNSVVSFNMSVTGNGPIARYP
jgi:predicted secreted protein